MVLCCAFLAARATAAGLRVPASVCSFGSKDNDSCPRSEERRLLCNDVSACCVAGDWVPALAGWVGVGARLLAASTTGDFVGSLADFASE